MVLVGPSLCWNTGKTCADRRLVVDHVLDEIHVALLHQ